MLRHVFERGGFVSRQDKRLIARLILIFIVMAILIAIAEGIRAKAAVIPAELIPGAKIQHYVTIDGDKPLAGFSKIRKEVVDRGGRTTRTDRYRTVG